MLRSLFLWACIALSLVFLQAAVSSQSGRAILDSDADGLEDTLEAEIGTDPEFVDTDDDTLSDYEEYCKYRTDPAKKDSDGDGKPDGDWDERREYTYTIRAICEVRPPNDMELMAGLYQDVRRADRPARLEDSTVMELLLFPFSTPHVYGQPYPRRSIPEPLQKYVRRTLAMNFSAEMQKEVKEIVKDATTDVEAIEKILAWIANETRLDNRLPEFAYFHVADNEVVWRKSLGSQKKDQQLLETNLFGDSMFKNRVHGTCSSMATLRATMLRAAGIPTRLIQTLPLINRYEGDPEPLVDRLRKRIMAKGYERFLDGSGSGANHLYNEVFLNNHWIRVDHVINPGPFVGDKLFVKVYSAADWDNLFYQRPPEESWNENRNLRMLDVSDAYATYRSEFETIDLAIADKELSVTKLPDGRFQASVVIHNNGNMDSPSFPVRFYVGDPEKGGRVVAPHAAGPMMPRSVWKEGTYPFNMKEGENQVFVVIDPDNAVAESDETNNRASKVVKGRLAKPKVSSASTSESETIDLAIADSDLSVTKGLFQALVAIHNNGNMPSPSFPVNFYAGDTEKGRLISRHAAGPIEPGSVWREGTAPFSLEEGENQVFVVIDPDNAVAESDETNNRASRIVGETPPKAEEPQSGSYDSVDVWISTKDIFTFVWPDDDSQLSGSFMVGIKIHSKGVGTIPTVGSHFFVGNPEEDGKLIGTGCLKMEAGQTASSGTDWDVEDGEYEVFVIVDPDNEIAETDESNNRASRVLKIGSKSASEF